MHSQSTLGTSSPLVTGPGLDPYMETARGAVSRPIPLGGWDHRLGTG
jgi:hypothetical protein